MDSNASVSVSKGKKRKRTSELKQTNRTTFSRIQNETMSSSQLQNSIDELSKENFGFNGNEAFYETKQIAFQGDSSWAFNTNGEPCSEMTTCMSALSHSTSFETAECGLREVKRAKRLTKAPPSYS